MTDLAGGKASDFMLAIDDYPPNPKLMKSAEQKEYVRKALYCPVQSWQDEIQALYEKSTEVALLEKSTKLRSGYMVDFVAE